VLVTYLIYRQVVEEEFTCLHMNTFARIAAKPLSWCPPFHGTRRIKNQLVQIVGAKTLSNTIPV
jgi:hypothetical protein